MSELSIPGTNLRSFIFRKAPCHSRSHFRHSHRKKQHIFYIKAAPVDDYFPWCCAPPCSVSNRSLWLDEFYIALNIVQRSFSQLLQPLDFHQAAPIGFLLIEKAAVQPFGNTEYALRLFPLFSGIVALLFLYKLASWYLAPRATLIALGLFSIADPLIYLFIRGQTILK